ncbi:hypothetical protein Leryth_014872 [Lithospermum erythrorhizon]|nr:hypothetical protein Leryth_014872 [Lithospermum erythrorhizon]
MGNLREAKRFWKDIMTSKCRPDKYTYGIYINALSKKGKINTALKVFRAMSAEGCTPDVTICNTIIHGLCFKNRVPEALEMLNRMKEKGDELNVVTYNTLIQHLCKIERMDKVAEVLDEMKEQGKECMPNTRTYSFLLSVAKDPKEVYDILDTMENSGCKMVTDTYNLLLRLFLNWGFDDKLASTWYEMEKSGVGPDERSYAIMIHGFHYKGKIEDALSYYHEMTLKGMIPEPQTKSLFDDMNDKLKQRNKQKIVSSFK